MAASDLVAAYKASLPRRGAAVPRRSPWPAIGPGPDLLAAVMAPTAAADPPRQAEAEPEPQPDDHD